MTTRRTSSFLLAAGLLAGAAVIPLTAADATPNDKVTICHAAGRDGTDKYVTLTLSRNAVFKDQGGHFYENGTPQAGHEDDYLGPCKDDDGPTTTVPDGPTTTVPTPPTTEAEKPEEPELIPPVVIERPTARTAAAPTPVETEPAFTG